jgi:hypothetical protein
MYRHERLQELRILCDPSVRAAITAMSIELRSFTSLLDRRGLSVRKGSA